LNLNLGLNSKRKKKKKKRGSPRHGLEPSQPAHISFSLPSTFPPSYLGRSSAARPNPRAPLSSTRVACVLGPRVSDAAASSSPRRPSLRPVPPAALLLRPEHVVASHCSTTPRHHAHSTHSASAVPVRRLKPPPLPVPRRESASATPSNRAARSEDVRWT
jgi:hypothetical protein